MREAFLAMKSVQDLAGILGVSYSRLVYHLYKVPDDEKYFTFGVPKRSGGIREVSAPATALKLIQRTLADYLLAAYSPRPCVHGFTLDRSVVTNASRHAKKRLVLNLDLLDYFPSINFGRVWGMFQASPFKFRKDLATVLAQICCFRNCLPQGAPTSPCIANLISQRLDARLLRLASDVKCHYTRYADDMTFSTRQRSMPGEICQVDIDGRIHVGEVLQAIINEEGFRVNPAKTRLQGRSDRQEVTGLVVNRGINVRRSLVRQVRAMLHAWERYGLGNAEREYHERYMGDRSRPMSRPPEFRHVVRGKLEFIGFVKGREHPTYLGLASKLARLDTAFSLDGNVDNGLSETRELHLVTEGKTDWRHVKAALAYFHGIGEYQDLDLMFLESETDRGCNELLSWCRGAGELPLWPFRMIALFDRDVPKLLAEIQEGGNAYRIWGPNSCSVALPIPKHRSAADGICIEMYYSDDDLQTVDRNGRRIFLNTEFSPITGRHKTDEGLICRALDKVKKDHLQVIDSDVFRLSDERSVALSKAMFAENVLRKDGGFANVSFAAFSVLFDVLLEIQNQAFDEDMPF